MRTPVHPTLPILLLHPLCSDSRVWTSVSALRGAACSSPVFMSGWLAGGVTTKLLQTDIFSSSGFPIICQINPADHLCAPSLLRAPNHHPIVFFCLSFIYLNPQSTHDLCSFFLADMTADLPQSCPRRWTSTCQADLSVSRRPWRKIEPAGRTERNYLLASPEGCGIMLRVHEKCPSFIPPLWIRSYIPTDLLCANWGIKKKRKEKKKKRSDAAQRWWRWCGGSGDPAGVWGGNFQWATGELKRT